MTIVFISSAVLGVAILLLQFIISLFGHHGDVSTDGHTDLHAPSGFFFGVLSVRAIATALAAFGMGGMAALSAGLSIGTSVAIGFAVGGFVMSVVVFLLRTMRKMDHSGTIDTRTALNQIARVYVPIPASNAGPGKIQLDIMQRTVELAAITAGPALATGTLVKVVQLVDSNTAEVISADIGKVG